MFYFFIITFITVIFGNNKNNDLFEPRVTGNHREILYSAALHYILLRLVYYRIFSVVFVVIYIKHIIGDILYA